jgi:hypothetical protein
MEVDIGQAADQGFAVFSVLFACPHFSLNEIQQAEPFDHINYSVFIGILIWESIQGGPGYGGAQSG